MQTRFWATVLMGALLAATGVSADSPRPKPRPVATADGDATVDAILSALSANPDELADADGALEKIEPVAAQKKLVKAALPMPDPTRGAVTNLPLPRCVSLKTNEGNARRGPSLSHRIDWVFNRAGMPLKITAEYEHWRRVEDSEGFGGWVHYSLLSGVRTVLVKGDMVDFHSRPRPDASISFRAEGQVVGKLMECDGDWCRVNIEGQKGWAPIAALWGVAPGEIVE